MRVVLIGLALALMAASPVLADMSKDGEICTNSLLPDHPVLKPVESLRRVKLPPQVRVAACKRLLRLPLTEAYRIEYLNYRGSAYADLKQYRQAIADYNQAIRLNPRNDLAYYNRGIAYSGLKQHRQAIADYNQAIRLNRKFARAYFNRGLIYQYHLKNRRQAIADYRAAYKIAPGESKYAAALREIGVSILPKAGDFAAQSTPQVERHLKLEADTAGHFYVMAKINGKPVRLLIDTGATSTILSQYDARRVGISLSGLQYKYPVKTANGIIKVALTNISKFQVGGAMFWNVRVLISPHKSGSVLGVRTLRRFKSYTVAGDTLTLRW